MVPPSSSGVRVRRIRADDGALLRELRLRSLTDSPEAFGQGDAEPADKPAKEWAAAARAASNGDRRAWFIAETDGHEVGLVLVRRRPPDEMLIFSMWVSAENRRSRVGRALIDTAAAWGRSWGARRAVLWVFATNETAVRFYDRLGFAVESDGADEAAGRAYGALAMSLSFDGSAIGSAVASHAVG